MNPHLLKTLFPNASKSVLEANATDYGNGRPVEDTPRPRLQNAKPQPNEKAALGVVAEGKEAGVSGVGSRVKIRITGYRVKPLDPDNFAGSTKDAIDALRCSGLIEGDEWWRITLETEQEKVHSYKEEKTVIEVIYP